MGNSEGNSSWFFYWRATRRRRDSRELRHHVTAVRGTAQNPMASAEVDEKSFHLLAPILGKTRARRLCDAVWVWRKWGDLRRLSPLLQA